MEIRPYKIIGLGKSSSAIVLPLDFVQKNHMEKGKKYLLKIDFIEELNTNIIRYRCQGCQHVFDSDDDIPYCPACGETSVIQFDDDKENEVQDDGN